MQLKTRTWFLISLVCFLLAGFFWHLGNERWREEERLFRQTNAEPDAAAIKELGANNFRHAPPPLPPDGAQGTARPTSQPVIPPRTHSSTRCILPSRPCRDRDPNRFA